MTERLEFAKDDGTLEKTCPGETCVCLPMTRPLICPSLGANNERKLAIPMCVRNSTHALPSPVEKERPWRCIKMKQNIIHLNERAMRGRECVRPTLVKHQHESSKCRQARTYYFSSTETEKLHWHGNLTARNQGRRHFPQANFQNIPT